MDDFFSTAELGEGVYFETILVGDRIFLTIDLSNYVDCDVFVKFYPTHFVIWIRGASFGSELSEGDSDRSG